VLKTLFRQSLTGKTSKEVVSFTEKILLGFAQQTDRLLA
jgi:hypothetical protein